MEIVYKIQSAALVDLSTITIIMSIGDHSSSPMCRRYSQIKPNK